jgi:hypothetical protein
MRSISQAEHFPGVMLSARTQNTSLVTKTTAINVNYLKMLRTTQGPWRCRQASLILEAFFFMFSLALFKPKSEKALPAAGNFSIGAFIVNNAMASIIAIGRLILLLFLNRRRRADH